MVSRLPPEIILSILSYLTSAQDVACLCCTCRRLNTVILDIGWKHFIHLRFPSVEVPETCYKDAAFSLTKRSLAWSRRALLASEFSPHGLMIDLESGQRIRRWYKTNGQSMGYQSRIDSYDEMTGSCWDARREVVAHSAGSQLIVAIKEMGPKQRELWSSLIEKDRRLEFDQFKHSNTWLIYKENGLREGYDDILNVNLVKTIPREGYDNYEVDVVFGRANGELSLLAVQVDRMGKLRYFKKTSIRSYGSPMKAVNVSKSTMPLLAASISPREIAFYELHTINDQPDSKLIVNVKKDYRPAHDPYDNASTVSTLHFISDELLAVGLSHSATPLKVLQLRSDGVSELDLPKIMNFEELDYINVDWPQRKATITCLEPVTFDSVMTGSRQAFLSSMDHQLRIHDLRSRRASELDYVEGGIVSLAMPNADNVAVGGLDSTVRIFDLRMAGKKRWRYTPSSAGWVISMNLAENLPGKMKRGGRGRKLSIYSLSVPSLRSTKLYAGLENTVVQMDCINICDRKPDITFVHGIRRNPMGDINPAATFDPSRTSFNLLMHNAVWRGSLNLMKQGLVPTTSVRRLRPLDERWEAVQCKR